MENGTSPGDSEFCVENGKKFDMNSNGVWFKDNPFNYVLPVMLLQIFLSIIISRLIYFALRPLRTPKFICSLLGGILLGPSCLGQIHTFNTLLHSPRQFELLNVTSIIATTYFIFILSMKMDTRMNLKSIKRTWRFGLFPVLSSFWVMSGLSYLSYSGNADEDMKHIRTILLISTSMTSFPVMSEILLELHLITSELGQIALSSSMLNELVQWTIVGVVQVQQNRNSKYGLGFVFGYSCFILLCLFVVRPMTMKIARSTPPGKSVEESFVVMIQLGVLVMAFLSDFLGLSFVLGPLVMGLVMPSGPPLATTVEERTEAIMSSFFLPLLFFSLGARINVLAINNWGIIFKVQLVIMAGFMAKTLACVLLSRTYKMKLKHGIVLGLMLNIKGMNDVIIFSRMRALQMMDDKIFTCTIVSTMALTAILSPLVEVLYNPQSRLEKFNKSSRKTMKTIQSTPRNSELHIISCVHKEGEVPSIIALLESLRSCYANTMCVVYVIHLIQLLGQSTPILRRINISKNKSWLLNYPNTHHIMRAFDNFAHNSTSHGFLVSVVPCINVAPYKTMHDSICNLAQDNCVPLIILPFHHNDYTNDQCTLAAIRNLNTNIQDCASCTVGILVDKFSRLGGGNNTCLLPFQVGVFFIGGADDREALALAMRMSEHENVKIVLFRFVIGMDERGEIRSRSSSYEEEESSRRLDESLIDEFRAMEFGNTEMVMEEVEVEGCEKVIDGIRRREGKYDLVMVGRKHQMGCFNDEEMSNFEENAEMLGMVGDMLASSEFCNGIVPVLVVQCRERQRDRS